MMFKATMLDSSLLKDSISTIGELIDEGIFKINKNGLNLTASDRAMVAVVDFKLPATVFDEFNVEKEENIGINISNLVSVLKRIKPKDKLILELKDNRLEITMKGESTRRFTVPLLDISKEELPPIDELDFKAKVKIKADVLKNGIEDADVVSDSVIFQANKDKFNIKASDDVSSAELTLEKGNEALLSLSATEDVKSRYPLDYLKKIVKASKLTNEALLRWSNDYPMRIDFSSVDRVQLSMILAPRVSED